MAKVRIQVQHADFDQAEEYSKLNTDYADGAIVTFIGKVREMNDNQHVSQLTLEHYPGMTEKVLHQLALDAQQRWKIHNITIIHRVGTLNLGEQIVFIGVSSAHRHAAFSACEFLIDFLKTQAPFWKLESTHAGDKWVDARDSDAQATAKW